MKESFDEFKSKLQKKYPDKQLVEKRLIEEDKTVIKLYGYCKRMDDKYGMGLVGKYYLKSEQG